MEVLKLQIRMSKMSIDTLKKIVFGAIILGIIISIETIVPAKVMLIIAIILVLGLISWIIGDVVFSMLAFRKE